MIIMMQYKLVMDAEHLRRTFEFTKKFSFLYLFYTPEFFLFAILNAFFSYLGNIVYCEEEVLFGRIFALYISWNAYFS